MATNEAKVISAVVKNKDVHTILGEDADLFGPYKDVFEFIKDYYVRYKTAPAEQLISEKFRDLELVDTTGPTDYHLEQLREGFVRFRIEEIMLKAGAAIEKKSPVKEIHEKLITSLSGLGKYTNGARDLDITDAEAAEEHFRKLRELSDAKDGSPGISTGFKSIDLCYPTGLAAGHFVVVMGYTGRGKSMWADLLAVKAWEQGYKPMIISLEMSPEEQRERIYAMMDSGMFRISDMSKGAIELDSFSAWSKRKFHNKSEFVVVSSEGIAEMTPSIIQAKYDTHRPKLIILDYLQLMKDNAKTPAMTPRMLNLSREIKMLATSNGIPVVAITAVTDEDGSKRDSPPVLSQVSWSSGIEYDANLAIAIHRYDDSNLVEAVCRKNRHGNLFDFYYNVDFDKGEWIEQFTL